MRELPSIINRLNLIRFDLIDIIKEKVRSNDDGISIDGNIEICGKKIECIEYFSGWREQRIEIWFSKKDTDYIDALMIDKIDDLILIAAYLAYH